MNYFQPALPLVFEPDARAPVKVFGIAVAFHYGSCDRCFRDFADGDEACYVQTQVVHWDCLDRNAFRRC